MNQDQAKNRKPFAFAEWEDQRLSERMDALTEHIGKAMLSGERKATVEREVSHIEFELLYRLSESALCSEVVLEVQ